MNFCNVRKRLEEKRWPSQQRNTKRKYIGKVLLLTLNKEEKIDEPTKNTNICLQQFTDSLLAHQSNGRFVYIFCSKIEEDALRKVTFGRGYTTSMFIKIIEITMNKAEVITRQSVHISFIYTHNYLPVNYLFN